MQIDNSSPFIIFTTLIFSVYLRRLYLCLEHQLMILIEETGGCPPSQG